MVRRCLGSAVSQMVCQKAVIFSVCQAAFGPKDIKKFGVIVGVCGCRKNRERPNRKNAAQKSNLAQ